MLTLTMLYDIIKLTKQKERWNMKNEKIINKHIEEVAQYLAQFMEFSEVEIKKVLYKFEMDIEEDIELDYVKSGLVYICNDVIIFGSSDGSMDGVDVRRKRYLYHEECEDLLDPELIYVGGEVRWFSRNKNLKNVGEV